MQGTSAALGGVALRERARSIFVVLALSKQSLFMCMGVVCGCMYTLLLQKPSQNQTLIFHQSEL